MRSAIMEDTVKFKAIGAYGRASGVIATAAVLSLGLAGSAQAEQLSHKLKPKPKPAPQVPGARLQSALLPASAFGDGFAVFQHLNTGNNLWSTNARIKLSSLSCVNFETYIFVGGYGNTAGATDGVYNPDPAWSDYPSIELLADQTALQFKTAQAATSFYNAAYTKYKQCSYFTETDVTDPSTTFELSVQSLSKTTINKNQAFQLSQLVDLTSLPQASFYENTAVVLSGTNVYTIDDVNGTNDPISASFLGKLIGRVQALYKHR